MTAHALAKLLLAGPDAPVTSFTRQLDGGKRREITGTTVCCTVFDKHNGGLVEDYVVEMTHEWTRERNTTPTTRPTP